MPPLSLDIPSPFPRSSAKPQLSKQNRGFTVDLAPYRRITLRGEGRQNSLVPGIGCWRESEGAPAARDRRRPRGRRAVAPGRRRRRDDRARERCSRRSIPTLLDRLAARLPLGSALVSATNGKTTTAAMVAEILSPRIRLAHNASGANLRRGSRPRSCPPKDAELGLFEVDEAALPEIARPGPAAGGLPRKPVPRPARPLRRARARCRALARGRARARRGRACSSSTATIRRSATSRGSGPAPSSSASTTRARRLRSSCTPRDSKWCLRCGTSVRVRGGLRRSSRRLPVPCVRACAAAPRRRRARPRAARAGGRRLHAGGAAARRRRVSLSVPGPLQRLQRARRGVAQPRARCLARRDRVRARRLRRRLRPLRADRRRRQDGAHAAREEPGGRERGRSHARRRRPAEARGARAERRDRGRTRRVLDLGRRLGAAAGRPRSRRRRPGNVRPRWRFAASTAGFPPSRSRSCPSSTARSTAVSS